LLHQIDLGWQSLSALLPGLVVSVAVSEATRKFADTLTRGQTIHGLVNSRTSQLAHSNFLFLITIRPHFVRYSLNRNLTLILST